MSLWSAIITAGIYIEITAAELADVLNTERERYRLKIEDIVGCAN
jgi:hypothetical protein